MIDFINLSTRIDDVEALLLRLGTYVDWSKMVKSSTGEVLRESGKYKGLEIVISKSQTYEHYHLRVKGSLQTFRLGTSKKVQILTMQGLKSAISELSDFLGINANVLKVYEVEISCTAKLSVPFRDFQNIYIGKYKPQTEKAEQTKHNKKFQGIYEKRTEYEVKMYDKGLHIENKNSNWLRVEVRYDNLKKLRKDYNIDVLSDFADPTKVQPLIEILESQIKDCIIIDKEAFLNISDNNLKVKLLEWKNPKFWNELDKSKRNKEKVKLEEYLTVTGHDSLKHNVLYTLLKTWNFAMVEQSDMYDLFRIIEAQQTEVKSDLFRIKIIKEEKVAFDSLEKNKYVEKELTEKELELVRSEPKKERSFLGVCMECKNEKTYNRKNRIYCSVECKRKANAKRLCEVRKSKTAKERDEMEKLKLCTSLKINIFEVSDKNAKAKKLKVAELSKSQIVKITAITVQVVKTEKVNLTKQRAKDYLRWLRLEWIKSQSEPKANPK